MQRRAAIETGQEVDRQDINLRGEAGDQADVLRRPRRFLEADTYAEIGRQAMIERRVKAEPGAAVRRTKTQVEHRAKALTNLGRIYLRQSANARALSCFEAALRIFQKLEPTPEHTEAIGRLHVLSAGAVTRSRVH